MNGQKIIMFIEAQAGFRKGMGTTDNIFKLHSLISHCVNEKRSFLQHLNTLKNI